MPVSLPSCSWVTLKTVIIYRILNNVKLEHTSTKLLGLHIQTDLAWKEHITSVAKGLSFKIDLFLRLTKVLKFDILYKLYFTLVVPHFNYCIIHYMG